MSPESQLQERQEALQRFWFLVDAPMFVDTALVERLHDAIIRPSSVLLSESEQVTRREEQERRYGITANGDVHIPFVVKAALEGEFGHTYSRGDETGTTRSRSIPRTTERLLEELVAFYLAHFPERVLHVDPVAGVVTSPGLGGRFGYEQLNATCQIDGPRPLVLVDGPRGTKIMPMAGEFATGHVEVFYDSLVKELSTPDAPIAAFSPRSVAMEEEEKAKIWQALSAAFEPKVAMNILEEAGNSRLDTRFEWIDFRVPWRNQGQPSPLHLHLVPAGKYSMGTFAHAFVRRGYSEGVRLVGTLKSGGDINVLAVYER